MNIEKIAAVVWRFIAIWLIVASLPMIIYQSWRMLFPPEINFEPGMRTLIPNLSVDLLLLYIASLVLGIVFFVKSKSLGALICKGIE